MLNQSRGRAFTAHNSAEGLLAISGLAAISTSNTSEPPSFVL
jgi:hypothetical protein